MVLACAPYTSESAARGASGRNIKDKNISLPMCSVWKKYSISLPHFIRCFLFIKIKLFFLCSFFSHSPILFPRSYSTRKHHFQYNRSKQHRIVLGTASKYDQSGDVLQYNLWECFFFFSHHLGPKKLHKQYHPSEPDFRN